MKSLIRLSINKKCFKYYKLKRKSCFFKKKGVFNCKIK